MDLIIILPRGRTETQKKPALGGGPNAPRRRSEWTSQLADLTDGANWFADGSLTWLRWTQTGEPFQPARR
jgi:hypothetical protein